jgi:hypothetical protein
MNMLRKGIDDEVTWLQCPDCEGYVPLLSSTAKEMMGLENDLPGTVVPDDVATYKMDENYDIGQIFYHSVWDDYGLVLQKGKQSQKGRAIMVSFMKGGLKKIVEDFNKSKM